METFWSRKFSGGCWERIEPGKDHILLDFVGGETWYYDYCIMILSRSNSIKFLPSSSSILMPSQAWFGADEYGVNWWWCNWPVWARVRAAPSLSREPAAPSSKHTLLSLLTSRMKNRWNSMKTRSSTFYVLWIRLVAAVPCRWALSSAEGLKFKFENKLKSKPRQDVLLEACSTWHVSRPVTGRRQWQTIVSSIHRMLI